MPNFTLNQYIGKDISFIPHEIMFQKQASKTSSKIYVYSGFNKEFLDDILYDTVAVTSNNQDTIVALNVSFNHIMDKSFFDKLVKKYGYPQNMWKKNQQLSSESHSALNGIGTVEITEGTLIECKFQEKPLIIKWQNPKYEMIFTLIDKTNSTNLRIAKVVD